ncbi:MAG: hypothetical protein ACE366_18085 [Bradymonadia bacterium]
MIKLDGERRGSGDSGPYTVVASGGPLGASYFRRDTHTLEEGLCALILEYAQQVWELDVSGP